MSKDRLIQSIALAANRIAILGLLLEIFRLRQNRTLMRSGHVRVVDWICELLV